MNLLSNFIFLESFGIQEPFLIIIVLVLILIPLIAMWKIFEKANKPGWAAIVPFYNLIVFMEIIGKPWWWMFLFMIPIYGLIWIVWGWNLMVLSFGKSENFTIGIILLAIVFIPILAFGDSKYIGPAGIKQ